MNIIFKPEGPRWPAVDRRNSRRQSINIAIIDPVFLAAFFGTAVACLLIGGMSSYNGRLALRWHDPGATYLLVGSSLYLLGTFLVTLVFNLPNYRSRSGDFATATDKIG
jgi:uncharacterized membrane protein